MIGSGVTLLDKANSSSVGIYSQAFFNLTIGLERTAKLVVLLDHYFKNSHKFFDDATLKQKYGHDLEKLLKAAKDIADSLTTGDFYKFPDTQLHRKFISFLSEFARTIRYYNLNVLTAQSNNQSDPIKTWNGEIGDLILEKHPPRFKNRVPDELVERMERYTMVLGTTEDHSPIRSVRSSIENSQRSSHINKIGRLLALQITRGLAEALSELRMKAYKEQASDIPDMNDFFRVYLNDDRMFLSRKTWKPI